MIKRNLPLMITLAVFVLGYLYCLTQFPGFASTRVICNILTDIFLISPHTKDIYYNDAYPYPPNKTFYPLFCFPVFT